MNFTSHIGLGLIFTGIVYYFFPEIKLIGFLIIFLSSVLIDLDHQLYIMYKKRTLNVIKVHKYLVERRKRFLQLPMEERKKYFSGLYILHGFEILGILALLSLIHYYFFYVLIGFSFHLVLDLLFGAIVIKKVDRFSLLWKIRKNRKLEYFA